jgi:hypothetical protein
VTSQHGVVPTQSLIEGKRGRRVCVWAPEAGRRPGPATRRNRVDPYLPPPVTEQSAFLSPANSNFYSRLPPMNDDDDTTH